MNRAERRALARKVGLKRAVAIDAADLAAERAVMAARAAADTPAHHELVAKAHALIAARDLLRRTAGLPEP